MYKKEKLKFFCQYFTIPHYQKKKIHSFITFVWMVAALLIDAWNNSEI